MWPGCLTSYGDDGIEALIPKGEIKVVTYHDFTSSIPGNLYQWPTVVTAQAVDLAVHFKILSSSTTYKGKGKNDVKCAPEGRIDTSYFVYMNYQDRLK